MAEIAVMGFGTVGSGVAKVIETNQALINKKAGQEININGTHIDTSVRTREQICHTAVIGMEMCYQNSSCLGVSFQKNSQRLDR